MNNHAVTTAFPLLDNSSPFLPLSISRHNTLSSCSFLHIRGEPLLLASPRYPLLPISYFQEADNTHQASALGDCSASCSCVARPRRDRMEDAADFSPVGAVAAGLLRQTPDSLWSSMRYVCSLFLHDALLIASMAAALIRTLSRLPEPKSPPPTWRRRASPTRGHGLACPSRPRYARLSPPPVPAGASSGSALAPARPRPTSKTTSPSPRSCTATASVPGSGRASADTCRLSRRRAGTRG